MEKTWMPTVGGIFNIICGAVDIIGGIIYFILAIVIGVVDQSYMSPGRDIATTMVSIFAFFFVIIGIVAITGGIRALHRYSWGLALAGSIISIFNFFWFLGVASVIFVAMSRKEFS